MGYGPYGGRVGQACQIGAGIAHMQVYFISDQCDRG